MAIFGLVLMSISIFTFLTTARDMEQKINTAAVEAEHAMDMLEDLKSDLKSTDASKDELDQQFNYYQQRYFETKKAIASIPTDSYQNSYLATQIGFAFGLFISAFGFFLWYTKLQKFSDAIIKNEYMASVALNLDSPKID